MAAVTPDAVHATRREFGGTLSQTIAFDDVARALGKEVLEDGYGITCADLDNTAKKQAEDFEFTRIQFFRRIALSLQQN